MKYSEDEIINLVYENIGYGFTRFAKEIYYGSVEGKKSRNASKSESALLVFFSEVKNECDLDLFDMLQETSNHKLLTRQQYREKTGKMTAPSGYGLSSSRTSKLEIKGTRGGVHQKILMPPSQFNWNGIIPIYDARRVDESLDSDRRISRLKFYTNVKLRNFRKIWEAYQFVLPITDYSLVSRYLDECPRQAVVKWVPEMCKFQDNNVLDEWFEVTEILQEIEKNNIIVDKEIMLVFRGTFEEYVKDPINNEKPSKEDIFWVFNQLMDELNQ